MHHHRPHLAFGAAGLALAVLVTGAFSTTVAAPARAAADVETRRAMAGLMSVIRVLLPQTVAEGGLGAPKARKQVLEATDVLARQATLLEEHVKTSGPDTGLLGRSLARDAREIRRRVLTERYEAAGFLLREMTDYCIACHARVPAEKDSPLAEGFVDSSLLRTLPAMERAHLQVATRQFGPALESYEGAFKQPDVPAVKLVPALTQYLVVSVRVRKDAARPIPVLEQVRKREDLWRSLRSDIGVWILSLHQLGGVLKGPPSLAKARQLIDDAHSLVEFRADRSPLVQYVVATAILHRLLDEKRASPGELAEIYFLLGVAESHIREDYWIEQAEAYLEAAIRADPAGPFAERAFARLEEELILTHTGAAGMQLPEDVERRLRELERVLERARPNPKARPPARGDRGRRGELFE